MAVELGQALTSQEESQCGPGTARIGFTPGRTREPGPSCGTASEFASANSDSFRRPDAKQERVPKHPLLLYARQDSNL